MEQSRARHRKSIARKSQQRQSKEALARVVFDSPPSVPETEGELELSSKKARKSLIDQIDELVREAPTEAIMELEKMSDEVSLELGDDEVVPQKLNDEVDPEKLPSNDYPDFVAEVEEPITK